MAVYWLAAKLILFVTNNGIEVIPFSDYVSIFLQ
jgi:hypothetical protein